MCVTTKKEVRMKNLIIDKLLNPIGGEIKKKPLASPLKVAADTIANNIAMKPLNEVTAKDKDFMRAYVKMEQARLGINIEKLKPEK